MNRQQLFSRSAIWDLQRRYFRDRGIAAWREGDVPHYVTNNPVIANAYAEMIFGFLQDRRHLSPDAAPAPLTICELGAGTGRLAFLVMTHLTQLCEQAGIAPTAFRYVLTDLSPANVDFWRGHRAFQPFFSNGTLDIALFDVESDTDIVLQICGATLSRGHLQQPLVVIANYVFDSIPQDLFYIDAQICRQCLVSVEQEETAAAPGDAALPDGLRLHYAPAAHAAPPYEEPWLQQLLEGYRRALSDTYLLFPSTALRCLQRLSTLSTQGMLLLSSDKGNHRLTSLQGKEAPEPAWHGSFSLPVNYHAIKMYCERRGGEALFPSVQHTYLNVNCCLLLDHAGMHRETIRAYQRHLGAFGPEDFYCISQHAGKVSKDLSIKEILAYLRLSLYDSHQLMRHLPRLIEFAPQAGPDEAHAVRQIIDRIWALYFPLGEEIDLADLIASLLFGLRDYPGALVYIAHSVAAHGCNTAALNNMAACCFQLGEHDLARDLLLQNAQ